MGKRFCRASCVVAIAISLRVAPPALSASPDEPAGYRENLQKILPSAPAFSDWIKRTDALPPDFEKLPRHNSLPDPLAFLDGRAVRSADDWAARREEILDLFQQYAWGKVPPHPKLDSVDVAESPGDGYVTRQVTLHFGPGSKGVLHVTLILPDGPGPFPVLVGPGLIGGFGGNAAAIALRRGYIAASYAGNDANDDSRALAALYPDHDFATLPRRAFAAGMVLDYLETLPQADLKRTAIFGYSRDGKQACIAAALDPRFAAVLAGSTGVGGITPYRLAGERNQAESIQSTTLMFPDWFAPQLRFFVGREDRLPVDGNLLLAAIAPRPVLVISGHNDEVSNNYGDEASIRSAERAYRLLGADDKVGLLRVPGFHGANDMEAALDFLDYHFGRSATRWTSRFQFPWDFDDWARRGGEAFDVASLPERPDLAAATSIDDLDARRPKLRRAIEYVLGVAPLRLPSTRPFAPRNAPATNQANPGQTGPDVPAWVIQRSMNGSQEFGWLKADAEKAASRTLLFGYNNVRGQLYYPADTPSGAKLPAVVYLHSYSYPLGYMWVYRRDLHPILALVKAGYAVLAYDQCGFGSRMNEAGPFYDRYPHWSQMGRLVEDARAAVDALAKDPLVDAGRIYCFGYSLGGNVALHAAALEPRVKGVVSVCGFTPMRSDVESKGTGGLARFSRERPLIPRLGLFVGREERLPYDYDDLIAALAPRPTYVISPKYDRDATPEDVRVAVEQARKAFALHGAADRLRLDEPWDYNRLPTETQDRIISWMKRQMP